MVLEAGTDSNKARRRQLRWSWRLSIIVAIVLGSLAASAVVYKRYQAVQETNAVLQALAFRNGVAVIHDLSRIAASMEDVVAERRLTPARKVELQAALDFLYVRIDPLEASLPDLDDPTTARTLLMSIRALVTYADLALAEREGDPVGFALRMMSLIKNANGQALQFVDEQFVAQAAAIELQTGTLLHLTIGAVGLLLLFAVIAGVSIHLFESEQRASREWILAEKKAAYLAHFDGLTGLPKRQRFREEASAILARTKRSMVLLVDVDDFKIVNDSYGHAAGDAVLRHVADCLRDAVVPHGGVAARLGGDEFVAMLPGPVSSMRAAQVCDDLIAAVNATIEYDNIQISQRVSVGVAISPADADPDADDPLSAMMKSADIALYQSKDEGKNTYSFYDSHLAEAVAKRRDLEAGIAEALRSGAFHLNFQPQVALGTGQIIGFEALARWTRDGKPVSPGEFIPVAEDTGQVVQIDLFAMNAAADTLSEWLAAGHPPITMSSNLSALHFRNEDIVDEVARMLRRTGLPPGLITLEVTESAMIESVNKVVRILDRLRALGVNLALDDFGTGYSSLAYLRLLPVDYIKIDQSFVRDLEESLETQIVMESLSGLAQGLNRHIVVEGIETEGQAALIRQMGCNYGQGYLFGRPLPAAEAAALLRPRAPALRRA